MLKTRYAHAWSRSGTEIDRLVYNLYRLTDYESRYIENNGR